MDDQVSAEFYSLLRRYITAFDKEHAKSLQLYQLENARRPPPQADIEKAKAEHTAAETDYDAVCENFSVWLREKTDMGGAYATRKRDI